MCVKECSCYARGSSNLPPSGRFACCANARATVLSEAPMPRLFPFCLNASCNTTSTTASVPKAALPRHSIRQAYFAPAGHLRPQPFARLAARAARRATAPFVELRALGLLGLSLREYPSLSAISVNFPISSAEHKRKREDLCRHLESSTDFVVAAGLLRKPVAQ